jgi:hypothetical protein
MDTSFWLDVCVCEYEYKTRLGSSKTVRPDLLTNGR